MLSVRTCTANSHENEGKEGASKLDYWCLYTENMMCI